MKKSIAFLASLALVMMLSFGATAAMAINAEQLVEQLDENPKKKKAKKAKAKKAKVKKEKVKKAKDKVASVPRVPDTIKLAPQVSTKSQTTPVATSTLLTHSKQ
ncbi:MAG: hypothetical protein ACPGJS_24185, partial [Flammeovirgaceae bacterium]